ncbi:MAG: hypothetical protein IJR00_09355 [Lachnospiraceae bacterium]|nr:hypothetical protein [Lachnospiraceae bacterium]
MKSGKRANIILTVFMLVLCAGLMLQGCAQVEIPEGNYIITEGRFEVLRTGDLSLVITPENQKVILPGRPGVVTFDDRHDAMALATYDYDGDIAAYEEAVRQTAAHGIDRDDADNHDGSLWLIRRDGSHEHIAKNTLGARISADGSTLLWASAPDSDENGPFQLHAIRNGRVSVLSEHPANLGVLSPDGSRVLYAEITGEGEDVNHVLLTRETGREETEIITEEKGDIRPIVITDDGSEIWYAVIHGDGKSVLYHCAGGTPEHVLSYEDLYLLFNSDGTQLICDNGTVLRIYERGRFEGVLYGYTNERHYRAGLVTPRGISRPGILQPQRGLGSMGRWEATRFHATIRDFRHCLFFDGTGDGREHYATWHGDLFWIDAFLRPRRFGASGVREAILSGNGRYAVYEDFDHGNLYLADQQSGGRGRLIHDNSYSDFYNPCQISRDGSVLCRSSVNSLYLQHGDESIKVTDGLAEDLAAGVRYGDAYTLFDKEELLLYAESDGVYAMPYHGGEAKKVLEWVEGDGAGEDSWRASSWLEELSSDGAVVYCRFQVAKGTGEDREMRHVCYRSTDGEHFTELYRTWEILPADEE